MKLSIIVPVYNEKGTILETLKRLKKLSIDKEIIMVDDGSKDGTSAILEKLNKKKNSSIKIIFNQINLGKGASIRRAIPLISGDYTIIQDADLEYDPLDIQKLLKPVLDGKAEVVYGSRFTGERRNMLFWHFLGNKILVLLINILFNTTLSDMETGYKLIKSKILKSLDLKSQKFEFEPEVTVKILKKGIKIYEVPISYTGRDYNDGKKITWRDAIPALITILKYRFFN